MPQVILSILPLYCELSKVKTITFITGRQARPSDIILRLR